jgi:hypothetical protein
LIGLFGNVYTFDQYSTVLIDGEFGMIEEQSAVTQELRRFYFEICAIEEKKKKSFL